MKFSPFIKQMYVAAATQLVSVSMGGSLMYPSILLHQFRSEESTIRTELDTLTWIAAMHGISGLGATLMPTIMQLKGRKYTFIGSSVILLIGWILAAAATNVFTVLLSAVFHGLASNCISIINLVTVSEMIAPKYRSALMFSLTIEQTIGQVIVAHLGAFLDWKTVAMIMCAPLVIALLMAIIFPESPSWLAFKGKFEETEKSFIWLRGTDDEANKELKAMIAAQKEVKRQTKKTRLQEMMLKLKEKDLYIPSLYMLLILTNFYGCGSMSLFVYAKDFIEIGTGNPEIALTGYIITSYVLLLGSSISIVLIKFFNSKTVLSTAFGSIICLIGCAVSPYLKSAGIISSDSLLFLYFFLGFMGLNNSGFNPVTFSLAIDLMPVKHRGFGGGLFNILTCILFVATVKTAPHIVLCIGLSWMFICFAVISTICTILIWIYVPETKNRTLQEIEDYYNFGSFVRPRGLEDNEVNLPIVKVSEE
nr:facilitated trehalose transporter Tret1 [Helicoverpa armigera]